MLVTLELWGVTQVWLYPSKAVLQWFVEFLQHLVRVTILDDIFEAFYNPPHPLKKQKAALQEKTLRKRVTARNAFFLLQ